jgi:adenylate cyclase
VTLKKPPDTAIRAGQAIRGFRPVPGVFRQDQGDTHGPGSSGIRSGSANDPVPVPDHTERAIRMALSMRDGAAELSTTWRRRGHELHVGIGVAEGYATIGDSGFEGRWDNGAIGSVTNLAFRLCGEAQAGQILTTWRVLATVDGIVEAEALGELSLTGFSSPVPTFNVAKLRPQL